MEVYWGGAPHSQLYESRASLTTLVDREWWAGWDSNPRSKDHESSALNTKLPDHVAQKEGIEAACTRTGVA